MNLRTLVKYCWPVATGLPACQSLPPSTASLAARPAIAYDTLAENSASAGLRVLFRPDNNCTYAVRYRAGHADTVRLGQYTGRSWAPPRVGEVRPAGGGHYLITLHTAWWDMGIHWSDVAVLCLGDTAATEVLFAEELDRRRAEQVPRGYYVGLTRQPASGVPRWLAEVADSTATGLRVRAQQQFKCGCQQP